MKTLKLAIALLLILLCVVPVQAGMNGYIAGVIVPAPASECTGSTILSAHFENSDTITTGTPAGCNTNADQTWSLSANTEYSATHNPAPSTTGSYNLHFKNEYTGRSAEITTDISKTEGTIIFDLYFVSSIPTYIKLVRFVVDANNYIDVMGGTDANKVCITYSFAGTLATAQADCGADGWHTITARWKVGTGIGIKVDSGAEATAALSTALTGTPSILTMFLSDFTGNEFFIDNITLKTSY